MHCLDPASRRSTPRCTRTWPDACTASINEPSDAGADYSTFDFSGGGGVRRSAGARRACRTRPSGSCGRSKEYRGRRAPTTPPSTRSAASGAARSTTRLPAAHVHVVQLHAHRRCVPRRRAALRDRARHRCTTPTPASARSSTPSSGAGAWDDTAFFLVADHGMEETDPAVTGDWDVALPRRRHRVPRRGLRVPLPRRRRGGLTQRPSWPWPRWITRARVPAPIQPSTIPAIAIPRPVCDPPDCSICFFAL